MKPPCVRWRWHTAVFTPARKAELGYLAPDAVGRLKYFSLRDSIPASNHDFQDVWRTLVIDEAVYFQTFNYLFRWSGGKMKVWQPRERFCLAFAAHGTLFMRVPGIGLMRMAADSLQLVAGGERFANESILAMLPFDSTLILIGTLAQGLFLYDDGTIVPFRTAADAFLRAHQFYHGAVLPGGLFALATLRGGVAIVDRQGNLCQILNKASGLRDERVHFTYADRQGGLWLALNNGIARIETPSHFRVSPPAPASKARSNMSPDIAAKSMRPRIAACMCWMQKLPAQPVYSVRGAIQLSTLAENHPLR